MTLLTPEGMEKGKRDRGIGEDPCMKRVDDAMLLKLAWRFVQEIAKMHDEEAHGGEAADPNCLYCQTENVLRAARVLTRDDEK